MSLNWFSCLSLVQYAEDFRFDNYLKGGHRLRKPQTPLQRAVSKQINGKSNMQQDEMHWLKRFKIQEPAEEQFLKTPHLDTFRRWATPVRFLGSRHFGAWTNRGNDSTGQREEGLLTSGPRFCFLMKGKLVFRLGIKNKGFGVPRIILKILYFH